MQQQQTPPQEPGRTPQLDWETPRHPAKRSFLDRLMPRSTPGASSRRAEQGQKLSKTSSPDEGAAKETLATRDTTLPTHTTSCGVAASAHATRRPPTSSSPTKSALQRRLDAVLPPHRTYLGRSRRFAACAVLLLAALFALCLGLGLGLGLRSRDAGRAYADLPLPSNTGTFTGDLTFYSPGLGACGRTNGDGDLVVSVSHVVFDAAASGGSADPNSNPLCGRRIRVARDYVEIGAGRRSVDVTVADRCVGCGPEDLDVAPAVFDLLAPASKGRVTVSWAWLE